MVTETRSARKSKDEADGHSSKKKVNIRKNSSMQSPENADMLSVRRSARETSLSRKTTPSPQSTRKSKRLEKGMPPLTLPVKRKSERLENYNTPSPLRRSGRGNKKLSSSSSGPKQSAKECSLSELKKKKEKTLIKVAMESEKAELDLEAVGTKRKKMNARSFKSLFKRQRFKEIVPDGDEELEGTDKLSHICTDNSRGIGSEPMENGENVSDESSRIVVGNLRDESIEKASDGALQKSICSSRGCHADIKDDTNVASNLRDNVVDEPCSKYSHTCSSVSETSDYSEKLPTNCSSTENKDAPESESSTCSARLRDGSVSLESSEKCMHPKEATPSPSPKCENHNLLRPCVLCSKNKRVGYDSPEQELCSCSPMEDKDLGRFSTCKDRSYHGAAVTAESAERCDYRHLLTETCADSQMEGHENVCALCNKDGELLCCEGKGCKRCYHLGCLDPPFTDALPGVWHCPQCVKKKFLFGVHSVSEGLESICDVREVEVSNAKGIRQRQYLVKYHGLAHVHNHWVPEKQLLLENPCLVSSFIEKDQNMRWSAEWMVPHRLLRKRSIQDKIYMASSAVISVCNYEWLVKWQGLSYEQATWELDNAYFLNSSLGQNLVKDYEIRHQKAEQEVCKSKKGTVIKLSELPSCRSHVKDNHVLENVNKLRECLFQCQNAVVFDEQERAMTVVLFIRSMSEICRPFLIVTASSSLSQWEAEFARLVPSVDVVVYSGNKDARKGIRASEFYEGGGRVMLEVLLSSAEAVFEDLDILRSIKWEAIIIDELQHSGISNDLEQIKMLTTDSRILLISGQIKDTTSEYLKILLLLESHGDFDKLRGLKAETNDNLCKLKDRLSRFIAYGSTSQVSKFLEYWVPAQISNYQLEHYCATILSNSISLRSCSRNDPVGALRDILLTVRKCCDHPYLLDSSVQGRLIAEQRPAAELLDIGIKASGKLQLLDKMLTEIKTRGLQVLILFQLIIGPGGVSTGDILDDFLRQRFGQNTYERIDAGVTPSRKQAAVNRFNKKETGQFVFLLENRACSSIVKLSSLDIVVIYDSDWNPATDLRALQKISIDSKVEQIKVFRLYSSFTVEERALVLAKQNLNLDNNLQNFSRTTSDTLLSWGAIYLFSKLDEYHADSNSTSDLNFSSGELLLSEVTKEFQAILSGSYENTNLNSVISKVKLGVGSYSTNFPLLGEAKVQFKDGEEPHVFWRNLLDGRNPQWKHLSGPSPRNRKRVCYLDGSPSKSETGKDDMVKKRKKMVNENLDPGVQVELEADQLTQVAVSTGGPSTIKASNQSENLQRDSSASNKNPNCFSDQSSGTEVSTGASEERVVSSDQQTSLHSFLQGEMTRLCQILKLSEDTTHIVKIFLEYVMKNHHVNSDSPSIVQAFQLSLCWIAASITKQKVDKKYSLMLAKQLLNYQCTEEQANSVYSKMRSLKRMYLQCSENTIDSVRGCLLTEEDIRQKSSNEEHAEGHILLQDKLVLKDKATVSEIDNNIKKIQKKCDKRMKKLMRKHQEEIQEFHRIWDEKRVKLETDHKLESAFIRSIHGQGSVRTEKRKLLDDNFAKKMEEHNLLKTVQLKDLEAEQLAAMTEERQKAAHWLGKAKALCCELRAVNGPQSLGSQSEEDTGGPQPSTCINTVGSGDILPMSREHIEDQNPSKSFSTRGNDVVAPSVTSSSPADPIGCQTPGENLVTVNSQNEVDVTSSRSSLPMVEHLSQSKHSSYDEETASANRHDPVEHVSDEIRSVDLSEQLPIEVPNTVANEVVGLHPLGLSNSSKKVSDKGSKIALPDALLSQRDGPDVAASGGLQSPGQRLVHSEQTMAVPDCCDVLLQQVQQDRIDQSLVSTELQDPDAPAEANQHTLQIEPRRSELAHAVTHKPSNLEAPVTDEIVNSVPSDHEAPVTGNSVRLHLVSVDVSLSCNESQAIEDHDQGRSSPQTAEPGGTEVLSHEYISQSGESLEIHRNQLDVGPVAHGQSVELSTSSQNDVAERPSQAVLQLGRDAGHLHGPSYLVHPPHQPTSWNSTPSLLPDPLQNELERIHKQTEQLEKNHEDMISQLKSDCEKEIQEIITQIRNKYDAKLQESEAEYRLKRNELDKNQVKVHMNKILAEAFRSKYLDFRPSGLPGAASSFMQQQQQISLAPSSRPSPGALACAPAPTQQITTPAIQTMQQLLRPRSFPVAGTSPPVQAAQHAATLLPSRPPVISAITPAGNPRVGGEIRSPAPHLQPFRPAVAASIPPLTSPLVSQLRPHQMLPSQPVQTPPPPPQPPSTNLVYQSIPPATSPSVSQAQPQQMLPSQPSQPPPPVSEPRPLPTNLVSQSIPPATSPLVSQVQPQQMLPCQPLQPPPPPPPPPASAPPPPASAPAPSNPSLSTLNLVVSMDDQPSARENRSSSPLPEICSTFRPLELADLEMLGTVQGNQTSSVATDVVCLSDDD